MTSVMRAMPRPSGSRALRAALVRGGRIIDERILPLGEHLTVGPTERSSFVVTGLPSSVRLLEWSRAGYALRLGPGMSGRLALAGAITDVDGQAARAPIPLDDGARGRVALGDVLVLFHFVTPPLPAARPQLPLAVKRGTLDGLDWKTTCIAAFSFLFHFGAVGTAYADFADATVEGDSTPVGQPIEFRDHAPPLPPLEEPDDGDTSKVAETLAKPAPGKLKHPGLPGAGAGRPKDERPGDVRAQEIARQLAAEGGAILLAIGGRAKGATERVVERGEMPFGQLENAAKNAEGVANGGVAGLNLPGSQGVVRAGEIARCLGCASDVKRDARLDDVGKIVEPRKPVGVTNVAPPDIAVGKLPDAGRVVGGLKGLLRACYNRALLDDPSMRGSVRVTAKVGTNGEVSSVQTAGSGLSPSMIGCVARVVKGAAFSPPEGGAAMVAIPMTFDHQ